MRILVYPHSMEIGGSQTNAVELAAGVRDLGHEVIVASEPGPMVDKVEALKLEHLPLPLNRRRPDPGVMRTLQMVVRERSVDVVHGHEWPPALEAFLGPRVVGSAAAVATVMSAKVAPFLPRSMPLVVGTEMLRQEAVADGYRDVTLIEPPVDVTENHPDHPVGDLRERYGVPGGVVLVAVVCRIVAQLKLEGILAACEAVGGMVRDGVPVHLLVVGDGAERAAVEAAATDAARVAGRPVVSFTGEMADPRPAYAAADVMIGMGGSALRGMAFGKPLVVQGERAYWRLCAPETVGEFLRDGWYGLADGQDGPARLRAELEPLVASPQRRAELGKFSRQLVLERFSLGSAAERQLTVYERAVESPGRGAVGDLVRIARQLPIYKLERRRARRRGSVATDDFNSLHLLRGKQQ